jgi:hypothetical protein
MGKIKASGINGCPVWAIRQWLAQRQDGYAFSVRECTGEALPETDSLG